MMGKSLNYAYPQRFAEGGAAKNGTYFVDNDVRDNTGHDMVLVTFDNGEKVYTNKAVAEAMIPGNSFASRDDYNKAFTEFTLNKDNFGLWHDKQVAYDQKVQEDPAVQANRAAIRAYADAINAGQNPDFPSLTSLGTPVSELAGVDKLSVQTPLIDQMQNVDMSAPTTDGGIASLVPEAPAPDTNTNNQTYGTNPSNYVVGNLSSFYRPPTEQYSVPTMFGGPINTQQVRTQAVQATNPFVRR